MSEALAVVLALLDRALGKSEASRALRLRPGCDEGALQRGERGLGRALPPPLRALYAWRDGQERGATGLFGGDSRFDPTTNAIVWSPEAGGHCRFLPLEASVTLYEELSKDDELDVFSPELVPFASDGAWSVYCLGADSGEVLMLWTGGPDVFMPRVWQTLRSRAAPSLEAFLANLLGPEPRASPPVQRELDGRDATSEHEADVWERYGHALAEVEAATPGTVDPEGALAHVREAQQACADALKRPWADFEARFSTDADRIRTRFAEGER